MIAVLVVVLTVSGLVIHIIAVFGHEDTSCKLLPVTIQQVCTASAPAKHGFVRSEATCHTDSLLSFKVATTLSMAKWPGSM